MNAFNLSTGESEAGRAPQADFLNSRPAWSIGRTARAIGREEGGREGKKGAEV